MMCVSAASAQFSNEPVISEPSFWYTMGFIPEEYTVGQQPVLVLENYDEATDQSQYVIYNSDLQKTKVIAIKNEIFKYGYDEDDIVHTYPTDIILISPKLAALDPEYITLTQTLFNTDANMNI
ncbi:MAG: hypothetical protein K2M65_08005 [Muribaculaceae bacterium]|nr:hypothetical protein [Muribaculaceae bacterium]